MIYELLLEAEGNSLTRKELEKLTGMSDRRNRRIIAEERKKHVILSSSHKKGYYLPKSRKEIVMFIDEEKKRMYNTKMSLKAAERELKRMDTLIQPELIGEVIVDVN